MMERKLLIKISTTVALLVFGLVARPAFAIDKPNILLFLVDDMGLMDTSAPMLSDENGRPQRHPGTARRAGRSLQQFLFAQCLFSDAGLDHERPKFGPPPLHRLHQSLAE